MSARDVIDCAIARSIDDRDAVSIPHSTDRMLALLSVCGGWNCDGPIIRAYGMCGKESWVVHLRYAEVAA